jgi:3-oxoacyl-[acyl-carrier-protein] synthase III
MSQRIGICGIGTYLPDEIRTNDWWSPTTIARWAERGTRTMQHDVAKAPPSPGAKAAIEALAAYANDPFKGAVQRRIAPQTMQASEMEIRAARDALARARIDAQQIEICLVHSVTPDYINTPNACRLHHELGLPERCLTMSVDGMCNAFQMQLAMAERMLQGRSGKYALLVQSCTLPRLTSPEEPASAWFGEGAAAVVVGPAADGLGVLATAHFTDGSKFDGLVFGVEGKRWYDEGRIGLYALNRKTAQRVILDVADHALQATRAVLAEIGARPEDVDFYACHQGTAWLRRATQDYCGLTRARSVDTFTQFASLSAANLPLILAIGEREGLLRPGDLTLLFSGGSGETWSATALRWGVE